jgi:hypothetical protein
MNLVAMWYYQQEEESVGGWVQESVWDLEEWIQRKKWLINLCVHRRRDVQLVGVLAKRCQRMWREKWLVRFHFVVILKELDELWEMLMIVPWGRKLIERNLWGDKVWQFVEFTHIYIVIITMLLEPSCVVLL